MLVCRLCLLLLLLLLPLLLLLLWPSVDATAHAPPSVGKAPRERLFAAAISAHANRKRVVDLGSLSAHQPRDAQIPVGRKDSSTNFAEPVFEKQILL